MFFNHASMKSRPQEVIIFVVGGTTYEESRSVALQNANNTGIRFILGGSVVLNSKRYAVMEVVCIGSVGCSLLCIPICFQLGTLTLTLIVELIVPILFMC